MAQVDRDPVNHCDPHLIDLFGAEDLGRDRCIMRAGFSQKDIPVLFFTWKCLMDSQKKVIFLYSLLQLMKNINV